MTAPTSLDSRLSENLELAAILLDECSVRRGQGLPSSKGRVTTSFEVKYHWDDEVFFFVESTTSLATQKKETVADIDVSFVVIYSKRDDAYVPDEMELERYINGRLIIQVLPFVREFLATMTNRMGLPPFFMPVFRHGIQPRGIKVTHPERARPTVSEPKVRGVSHIDR